MSKNLIARLIVAAIFIPLILWISYEGGWWLYGLVIFLAAMAMSEFLVAEGYSLKRPAFWLVLVIALLMVVPPQLLSALFIKIGQDFGISGMGLNGISVFNAGFFFVITFLLAGMLIATCKQQPQQLFAKNSRLIWGLAYIGFLFPFIYRVGTLFGTNSVDFQRALWPETLGGPQLNLWGKVSVSGGDALLFLFAILWIGDTAAMYVGKTIGRHKLAPSVSPNKTVEGFIGGLVAALMVGIVMAKWKFSEFPMYQILIVAVLCSLFGQLGDLVESMWKRSLNLKDSSAIIPGHGGFLDRFDSLLFAAPVMYYFFVIFR